MPVDRAVKRTSLLRRTRLRAKPARTPLEERRWRNLRATVHARAEGRCECCGLLLRERWECHHRHRKSQGGTDTPSNCVALRPECHARWHGHIREAVAAGFIVHAGDLDHPWCHWSLSWVRSYATGYELLDSPEVAS